MKTLSYAKSRARNAEVLDSVIDDREEVVTTRAVRSPANARRLLDAQNGKGSRPRSRARKPGRRRSPRPAHQTASIA